MGYPVRPSGYVGWVSTGGTNIAEPLDAKKASGWSVSEKPQSSYLNWVHQKQDQWIQYLDWRSRLRPAVYDDFVRAPAAGILDGPSSLSPYWFAYVPSALVCFRWTHVDPGYAAAGSLWALTSQSGYSELLAHVGQPGSRDFRMEHVAACLVRGNASNISYEMGLMYQNNGQSGGDIYLGWQTTGPTGALFARWKPSGSSPTAVNLGGMPSNASSYHRFTIEGRSPTMAFYIDDAFQFAAPMVLIDNTPGAFDFGVRIGGQSGAAGFGAQVDLMEFSLAR